MARKKNPAPQYGTSHGDSVAGICFLCDNERDPILIADRFVTDQLGRLWHWKCKEQMPGIDSAKMLAGFNKTQ